MLKSEGKKKQEGPSRTGLRDVLEDVEQREGDRKEEIPSAHSDRAKERITLQQTSKHHMNEMQMVTTNDSHAGGKNAVIDQPQTSVCANEDLFVDECGVNSFPSIPAWAS